MGTRGEGPPGCLGNRFRRAYMASRVPSFHWMKEGV